LHAWQPHPLSYHKIIMSFHYQGASSPISIHPSSIDPSTSGGPICIQRYSVEYPKFVPKKFVYTVCTSMCILEKEKYRSKKLSYQILTTPATLPPNRWPNKAQQHRTGAPHRHRQDGTSRSGAAAAVGKGASARSSVAVDGGPMCA
jgi:hypothetical protein